MEVVTKTTDNMIHRIDEGGRSDERGEGKSTSRICA